MAVTEKLYPPTIASSIPAFYNDGGTAQIAVPFSMNRAVSQNQISKFALKIKTAQSNNYITTLYTTGDPITAIGNKVAIFAWPSIENSFSKITPGQYLKIQLAYVGTNDIVGYFSTVATIKFTTKPTILIKNAVIENDEAAIPAFKQKYTGIYRLGEDLSERPYSYCFYLYDALGNIIETTDWQLHNTSMNNIASEALQLQETIDEYEFETSLKKDKIYYIQYAVKTMNDLEIYTPMYPCIEPSVQSDRFEPKFEAKNNFEEGYINLSFSLDFTQYYTPELKNEIINYYNGDDVRFSGQGTSVWITKVINDEIVDISNELTNLGTFGPTTFVIQRAEVGYIESFNENSFDENLYDWKVIRKVFIGTYSDLLTWKFKDLTIEQGVIYRYCVRKYNDKNVLSSRIFSDIVEADFEDMFIWDGKKQLKVRFNPKVSSFKMTRQEQKIDTIGNKFPFIFRNGIVNYREFPIGGLISYLADNNEMFVHHEEDLNILLPQYTEREGTPTHQETYKRVATLDSIGYNMHAERRFKMKLLEWLNDGQTKLFRSPAEGNFLIRIMNVSLTPEDRVGRLIHSFQAQAVEVAELSYNKLLELGFFNLEQEEIYTIQKDSVYIKDLIEDNITTFQINKYGMLNYVKIYSVTTPFWLRFGTNDVNHKVLITQNGYYVSSDGGKFPNLYYALEDQPELTDMATQIGDAILEYDYSTVEIVNGKIQDDDGNTVSNVYVKNEISMVIGPENLSTAATTVNNTRIEYLQFFELNFKAKTTQEIWKSNGKYYTSSDLTTEINIFEDTKIYKIWENNNITYYAVKNGRFIGTGITINDEEFYRVFITPTEGETYSFAVGEESYSLMVNSNNIDFQNIRLCGGVYLNYSCQKKYTEYES